jgi:predicted HicB family RNase H-like nuclease
MSFDPNAYNITVRRTSTADGSVFVARVLELPDVRGFGESASEAYDRAVEAVEALYDSAAEDHEEFPTPIEPEDEYSGRVTLRMPKTLHRDIAVQAEREDVSINSYIVTALAKTVTMQHAMTQVAAVQLPAVYRSASSTVEGAMVGGYYGGAIGIQPTAVVGEYYGRGIGYQTSAAAFSFGPEQSPHAGTVTSSTSAMIHIIEPEKQLALRNPLSAEVIRERRRA